MIYKDCDGERIRVGDEIRFSYGIPPTIGFVLVGKEDGRLMVEDAKGQCMRMSEFMKYYGDVCYKVEK